MIRCCRDRCEPGTECGCADCAAKKWPQYAKQTGIEQMAAICPGCQEISDLPRVHEVMSNFSTDPTEDNGIAVVQAIVQATTRKSAE